MLDVRADVDGHRFSANASSIFIDLLHLPGNLAPIERDPGFLRRLSSGRGPAQRPNPDLCHVWNVLASFRTVLICLLIRNGILGKQYTRQVLGQNSESVRSALTA